MPHPILDDARGGKVAQWNAALEHGDLLSEREVLQGERCAGEEERSQQDQDEHPQAIGLDERRSSPR